MAKYLPEILSKRRASSSSRVSTAATMAGISSMSSANVRSTLIDLRTREDCTRRLSSPRATSNRRLPYLPKRLARVSSGRPCRSPQVTTPILRNFSAVTRPTPLILFTGNATTKSATSSGVIVSMPSGLFQSLATLARNLLGAMPADTVRPSSSLTRWRISRAIRVALPWH